jgi:uncharacterized protein
MVSRMRISLNAMQRKAIAVCGAVSAVAFLSACDREPTASSTTGADNRLVTVIGSGQVQGTPDTMTIDMSIVTRAANGAAAMADAGARSQRLIDLLIQNGVDRRDIATANVTVQPRYGTDSTDIVGYEASNTLKLTVRDLNSAPRVFGPIETAGDAARINSTSLSIDNDSQLVKDARARAFDDAKSRAEQYAQLAGVELGEVVSISETGGTPPPVPMAEDRAAAAMPVEPGQQTVRFTVTVAWEIA